MAYVFPGSKQFWEDRYAAGGDSGEGSRGSMAAFKAETVNHFIEEHAIKSVIEFGCGDGNQLSLMCYPAYLGLDVSPTVVAACRERYPAKTFALMDQYTGEQAELALSLDVIFHLIEDDVFHEYMSRLFDSATRYVLTFSPDSTKHSPFVHIKYRMYSEWVAKHRPKWELFHKAPRPDLTPEKQVQRGFSGFYFWQPRS